MDTIQNGTEGLTWLEPGTASSGNEQMQSDKIKAIALFQAANVK